MTEPESVPIIKRRSRPQPRQRQLSIEVDEPDAPQEEQGEDGEQIDIAGLLELRKLRKAREGIDVAKLGKGDIKKKRKKRPEVEEEEAGGLRPGAGPSHEQEEEDEEAREARARRVVRANNFTQQTNALDVDKHMMAYIEENMRLKRGVKEESKKDQGPLDPLAELFRKKAEEKGQEEGNVTNSLGMLTAIPEVDLGMDVRLKNIEETEKAKRIVAESKQERKKAGDEEHLTASRFYRPNLKMKSDADILRDAKLEAMGLHPEDHEPRRTHERPQMATDEIVMERFKKRMRK